MSLHSWYENLPAAHWSKSYTWLETVKLLSDTTATELLENIKFLNCVFTHSYSGTQSWTQWDCFIPAHLQGHTCWDDHARCSPGEGGDSHTNTHHAPSIRQLFSSCPDVCVHGLSADSEKCLALCAHVWPHLCLHPRPCVWKPRSVSWPGYFFGYLPQWPPWDGCKCVCVVCVCVKLEAITSLFLCRACVFQQCSVPRAGRVYRYLL